MDLSRRRVAQDLDKLSSHASGLKVNFLGDAALYPLVLSYLLLILRALPSGTLVPPFDPPPLHLVSRSLSFIDPLPLPP